jgi:lipid A 3-O-deacylase
LIRVVPVFIAACLACASASPARAAEIFGGLYVHDIDSPLTKSGVESGIDLHLGWRGDPLTALKIRPHAFVSVNSAGNTHYAALGISRKFGSRVYIRPGVGIAIHTGSATKYQINGNDQIEFGSRLLFEPELAIGTRLNDRISLEASWVHLSHAQLFSGQNPGIDNVGVRLNYRL